MRMQCRDLARILGPVSDKQVTDTVGSAAAVEHSLPVVPLEPMLKGEGKSQRVNVYKRIV